MKNHMALGAAALLIAGAVGAWRVLGPAAPAFDIETAPAAVGEVRAIVSTTGAVRALVTVEVGSQLSGQVAELRVDYNARVAAGDILARIDPQSFETRVRQAEAAYEIAAANIALQEANIARARANLLKAEQDFTRAESLRQRGAASQAALDAARAARQAARADLAVAQAQSRTAAANLLQSRAGLDSARIDLERTFIRSPIDGVVVDRSVDLGQTVAASLAAPTLFTIAQDLTRIQIDAEVDEADIGRLREGQAARFTVDAFPEREFTGVVEQIRLSPTELQNVVTYTAVISADNPNRRLLPGMTANVDIITGQRAGVLTVVNQALRFAPRGAATALIVEGAGERGGPGGRGGAGGRGGGPGGFLTQYRDGLGLTEAQIAEADARMRAIFAQARAGDGPPDRELIRERMNRVLADVLTSDQMARLEELRRDAAPVRRGTVWVKTGDRLRRRSVVLGLSDARVTEIRGGIEEGAEIAIRVRERP